MVKIIWRENVGTMIKNLKIFFKWFYWLRVGGPTKTVHTLPRYVNPALVVNVFSNKIFLNVNKVVL